MPCKTHEVKEILTAKAVEFHCTVCKEITHTRTRVLSSNIFAVARVNKHMEVQFINQETKGPGKVYLSAQEVPRHIYDQFLAYKSKGKFFAKFLKDSFDFEEIKEGS